ncbi:monocarboxylate transporter 12-like [Anneissia japonica]|uniref:monocarboxylate transporter 12-like n=1 Tax=Anneissia japonica TaxID=1529436 RepID=UPI001425857D|nr:monocarboxylate transporter 12-like [Anneissia japonica]XP_033123695.1 monocarboxylate transporter 12-like [Anneissia japonica]XP_033123696.1 monocarboxylate transporter 12-like [Anneissia japonica]
MKWGWVIVLSGLIQYTMFLGFLYSYNLLNIQLKESFNTTATKSGLPGSISMAMYCFWGNAATVVFQRFGHMVSGYLGVLLCCISLLLSSFAQRIEVLYLTYGVLYGFGCSSVYFTTVDKILLYYRGRNSTRALGIALLGSGIGVLMAPCLEWLYAKYTWRTALRILSVMYSLFGCLAVFPNAIEEKCETETNDIKVVPPRSFCQRYSDLCKRKDYTVMLPANMMVGAALTFSYVSLGSYLNDAGMEESSISLALGLMGCGELVGRLLMSLSSAYLKPSPTFQYGCIHIISSISLLPLLFSKSSIGLTVILFAFSISRGMIFVVMVPAVTNLSPENSSSEAIAVEFFLYGIGAAVVPYITDQLFVLSGSYDSALYVCVGLFLFSGLITFVANHINKKLYHLKLYLQRSTYEKVEVQKLEMKRAEAI